MIDRKKAKYPNVASEFVALRSYCRWLPEQNRRESWEEVIDRVLDFLRKETPRGDNIPTKVWSSIYDGMINFDVMPSMRLVATAGQAAKHDNVCLYNCSYTPIDSLKSFSEMMYILMCGTGVGFSVEKENINKLPTIKHPTITKRDDYIVQDSREGWADAFQFALETWFNGEEVHFNFDKIRPYGTALITMGGRASGPDPLKELFKFTKDIITNAKGRKLSSIECHDICCKIAEIVVVGGTRRSALISFSDLEDEYMRHAKDFPIPPHRFMSNNTAVYKKKPDTITFLKEWSALAESGSGERGILNVSNLSDINKDRKFTDDIRSNPCITGETLVYVADGRGHVSIKTLAEENNDIPVFCLDDNNKIQIRTMRNPRITGNKEQIYKITLDSGDILRVTGNHKLLSYDGYINTNQLKIGDGLLALTKFQASMNRIKENKNKCIYEWLRFNNIQTSEHKKIAEHYYNTIIDNELLIHHKDKNSLNNNPKNLEIITRNQHTLIHGSYPENKNPNYSGITNEELQKHAINLTKKLNRRFSINDWIEYAKLNSLPQYFSKWRKDHLGSVIGIAKWAALILKIDNIDCDPRIIKTYKKLTKEGYNCEIINNKVFIIKNCEVCGNEIKIDHKHRETSICSYECNSKRLLGKKLPIETINNIKKTYEHKRQLLQIKQIKIYNDIKIKTKLEYIPKKLWQTECKNNNVSFEISRTTSPFKSYNSLVEAANNYNHRIVSIELDGFESVYNGTVDEFHNFFIGGFESNTKNNKRKLLYFNNLQCGEILLRPFQFCNLSEAVIRSDDDIGDLFEKVKTATWLGVIQSTFTYFPYIRSQWKKNCEEERLIGVSLTGQLDNSTILTEEILKQLKKVVIKTAKHASEILKITTPKAYTCSKPSGTVSQVVDSASGCHPRFAKYYIRRYRISKADPLYLLMKDQGVKCHPEVGQKIDNATTMVVEFPIKSPDKAITITDWSSTKQLEWYLKVQKNWSTHNVSNTVYVKNDEWIKIGAWVYDHFNEIVGISFLPLDDHKYDLAPYEEITEKEYNELIEKFPKIDFTKLNEYENNTGDKTEAAKTLSCVGDRCELK